MPPTKKKRMTKKKAAAKKQTKAAAKKKSMSERKAAAKKKATYRGKAAAKKKSMSERKAAAKRKATSRGKAAAKKQTKASANRKSMSERKAAAKKKFTAKEKPGPKKKLAAKKKAAPKKKPTMFVGSSSEGLAVAQEVAQFFTSDPVYPVSTTVWNEFFGEKLGQSFLDSLIAAAREFDFALLVLTPDDPTTKRANRGLVPRDNVMFEAGLFMGSLGRERTFIFASDDERLDLATDFDGISIASYTSETFSAEGGQVRERKQAIRGGMYGHQS